MKYKNIRCEHNGIKFDSQKERDRYIYLKQKEDDGFISNLELQKRFVLIEKQILSNGALIDKQTYVADFCYYSHFGYVVEDVKGRRAGAPYKLFLKKKANMGRVYGINVIEI